MDKPVNSENTPLEAAQKRTERLRKRFKECPFCSKPVSISASVCRHCRRTLDTDQKSASLPADQTEFLDAALSDLTRDIPPMPSVEDIIEDFSVFDQEQENTDIDAEEELQEEKFEVVEEGKAEEEAESPPEENAAEDDPPESDQEHESDESDSDQADDDEEQEPAEEEADEEQEPEESPPVLEAVPDPEASPIPDEIDPDDNETPSEPAAGSLNSRTLLVYGGIALFLLVFTVINMVILLTLLTGG